MSLRLLALPLLLLLAACAPAAPQGPVVLAAASLQDALEEAADSWAAQGQPRPVLSFAGTPALVRQIAAGAPADVFISADEQWMDWLEQRQLLRPGTRRVIASNALVSIVPQDTMPFADSFANVTHGRIALADPDSVPAGRYARAALQAIGAWEKVEPHLIPTENVRAALRLVELGEADGGVVYASDAAASDKVTLVYRFDPGTHPPIAYPAAVLADATSTDAEPFLAFLASDAGQAILQRHGFLPAP